jgi:hypothetical protein
MMDRYASEKIEQDMSERAGTKFLQCSLSIYEALKGLPQKKAQKLTEKLQDVAFGVNQLKNSYSSYEADRPKFIIPEKLRNDYRRAYYNYGFIRNNPEEYFKQNDTKIDDLEKEKQFLIEKIRIKEVKFARHEDDVRHEKNFERTRLIAEIGKLRAKKEKYEEQSKSGKGLLSACFGGHQGKIEATLKKLTETESRLREISGQIDDNLEAKRYQLTMLHKRRWSIEKTINAFADSPKERTKRWHKAIDEAEILMNVRRLEIDDAMSRYYAEYPKSVFDSFLNVYSKLHICADNVSGMPDKLKSDFEELSVIANMIFKAGMPYRSLLGLYTKLLNVNVDPEIDFSGASLRAVSQAVVNVTASNNSKSVRKFPTRRKVRGSEADDLPDITPQLLTDLQSHWKTDDVLEEPPARRLASAVREHMDVIKPYIDAVKEQEEEWGNNLLGIYQIAQTLEFSAEAYNSERTYSVPSELKIREIQANMDLGKIDGEWETAKLDYAVEIDKRQAELVAIKKKMQDIHEAKDVATLLKLQWVPDHLLNKPDPKSSSLFSSWFGQHKKDVSPTPVSEEQLENLRAGLLKEHQDYYIFKNNSLTEYLEQAPTKPVKYRRILNEVKAEIIYDQIKFLRRLDLPTMLNCVRLYVLAFRTYYQIYHENPFSLSTANKMAEKPKIALILNEADLTVLKAKSAFQQLVNGMRDQLENFYCLQPCRCDFNYYLDNFNNIQDVAVRDAILCGKQDDTMLENVFPKFSVPEEALPMLATKTI